MTSMKRQKSLRMVTGARSQGNEMLVCYSLVMYFNYYISFCALYDLNTVQNDSKLQSIFFCQTSLSFSLFGQVKLKRTYILFY